MLPHTTKRRITTNLKTKKQPDLPEKQAAWKSDNQVVKEETFIQTGMRRRDGSWGREVTWQGSGCYRLGRGWQTRQSHLHVQISWEEQLGSKIDCTTQGSRKETKASKPLIVKTCGSCSNRRNSQSHRKVCRRGPQDPRMYTSPPIWESAPERAQSTCGK